MKNISNDRDNAVPYKRFGKIEVKILDPIDMSIGKIERFTDIDIQDVMFIIKEFSMKSQDLLVAWAKALNTSVKSETNFLFRKQVELFIKSHSMSLWKIESDPLLHKWSLLLKKT